MAKNLFKIKSVKTNVRNLKVKKRITHFLLSALWHLVPDATKNITAKRFFAPVAYPLTPLERKYLDNGKPFHIHVHDKKIQCWQWGRGPAILFVHGWNGRGVNFVIFFEALIKAGYSIITYDAPAHGKSEGQVTNYFELTDTVRSFLDPAQGFNIRGVIAHSLGASAVINCMSKDKPSIDTILIAPALKLKELVYNSFDSHGIPKIVYQTQIAELEGYYGYNWHKDNPFGLAKNISSKILIVHDKDDPTTPYMDSKVLSEELKNVYLHTTEGLGHKRIFRDNNVVDVVLEYLFSQSLHGSRLQQA